MKIKNIKKAKPKTVYAIKTSTKTFIADGLAHHNCPKCNLYLSGNRDEYLRKIQLKYGIEEGDRLLKAKDEVHYYSIKELNGIIETYIEKLKEL
jgi:hypothetical protein